ncbi:putative ribonuclease H-like domain-containing protein [Tanacetum coccineum]
MDLETAQLTTTAKLPTLKQGEYDMWRLRIEQYFQVQDYALWDVIENGNSFKPAAKTTTNVDGTSTTRNQYKDAKTLFAAIQIRFGGNEAIKKNQKTLLKQMYENFSAPSTESLDSIFNRLQKIVSQLAILGENISQEDLNLKFLRSLPSEWNTHVVVWRNKPDLDTMSFDDLYNNFKIVEQEVKGTASSSSSSNSQNMAFVSSPSSTNEVNTAYGVSTANTQVSPASTQVSTAIFIQPNGSQLVYEDLEQIHKDDIEEMDLKWQLALLSMRTRRGPRNQDNRNMNQDSSRRTVNVEEISSKAMLAIDGAGFDWSYMADDEVPTNMALMDFSDSEVHNDKTCSKTYLKSFETLKTQLDDLRIEFNKSEFNLANYKRGLASVEEQLVFYKKNEVIFCEQLVVLKRDISYKDSEISVLKGELEKLKQEKESNQLKIENFDNASKSLDKLIGSQIPDKSRKGLGFVSYNVVPPPPTGLFSPLNLDLSYSGLEANCNYHQRERVVSGNNYTKVNYNYSAKKTHPIAQRNMVPRAILMKTGLRSLNTDRPVNTAHSKTTVYNARPMSHFSKSTQSTVKRTYQTKTTLTNKNSSQKVNTAKGKLYIARPKAVNTARTNSVVVNVVRENQVNAVKASACWVWRPTKLNSASITLKRHNYGHPQKEDQGYVDSGCSRHMTGNMSYLSDFKEFDGGYVTFGGGAKGGKITSKGTLKTGKLDFEDIVLFTDTACFVLSPDFKLPDESQVLLKVPRKNNMYSVDMKNIVPKESLTCLVAKATLDESMLWHRRLGHVNFKTINKLVKDNLVRGLPSKGFENDQTCVACLKGKQHKASCKSKIQNSITQPLFMLNIDLFGLTFVSRLMNMTYCLVVTNDYSRFTWVFFLATKDETSGILKSFITEIENLVDKKVKIIKCDNGIEFKNKVMSEFYEKKGIKMEFCVARTPQQNGVAKKEKYETLIEAKLEPCCILLSLPTDILGRTLALSFMKPFGCHVTILNILDYLGKFDGNSDEGFFVGYSLNSKDFRVYNIRTTKVEESLHIRFLEDKPIIAGDGLKWLFDIDVLTKSMNYVPDVASTNSNDFVECNDEPQPSSDAEKKDDGVRKEIGIDNHERPENSSQDINTVGPSINTASTNITTGSLNINTVSPTVTTARSNSSQTEPDMLYLGDNATLEATHADFFGDEIEVDMSNITTTYPVPSTLNTRIHKDHSLDHVIGDVQSGSAFLYGKIEEEVYVYQPLGFEDPEFPDRVYKVENAIYGLHQAPRACYETLSTYLLDNGFQRDDINFGSTKKGLCTEFEKLMHKKFQMSFMGELTFFLGLQVTQKDDGIFISQDKYVDDILKKFGFSTMKIVSTPIETLKPLLKDAEAEDVDVHLYRSMIGSLMYLTASRPDIMFVVCACARFQVTPKVLHLHVVKRIFKYLKGQPKLGLWYPKDSPFDLEAYTDNDYAGASLNRKSTTGGCQFLERRLISWQCKKQTIVANFTTKTEYVAASCCCGQVLWIQNQMLDYRYNFMNTKIFIDNESTICIVKNQVFHSKTKHIEIKHHFIRDSYKKRLIQVIKIHTDHNVVDLLIKAFNVSRFQYLIASIEMLNL